MTDAAPVSTARGAWSVALAASSPAVGWIAFMVIGSAISGGTGGLTSEMIRAGFLAFVATWIAAVVLGVASIVVAWPLKGRPGRTKAIVLGSIGIAISALIVAVVLPVMF